MGTHGLRAAVARVRGGEPRHRLFDLCAVSLGLLAMLAGCSSSASLPGDASPPPVVGTGYGTAINTASPSYGPGPSGLLVDLLGSKPAPTPAAGPSPPGIYTLDGYMLAAQMPVAPPPSNNPTSLRPPLVSDMGYGTAINPPSPAPPRAAPPPAVVGTGYGTAINTASPSYGPGPSGLLVDLFGSKPAPAGAQ